LSVFLGSGHYCAIRDSGLVIKLMAAVSLTQEIALRLCSWYRFIKPTSIRRRVCSRGSCHAPEQGQAVPAVVIEGGRHPGLGLTYDEPLHNRLANANGQLGMPAQGHWEGGQLERAWRFRFGGTTSACQGQQLIARNNSVCHGAGGLIVQDDSQRYAARPLGRSASV
jgi:hypothetical protein